MSSKWIVDNESGGCTSHGKAVVGYPQLGKKIRSKARKRRVKSTNLIKNDSATCMDACLAKTNECVVWSGISVDEISNTGSVTNGQPRNVLVKRKKRKKAVHQNDTLKEEMSKTAEAAASVINRVDGGTCKLSPHAREFVPSIIDCERLLENRERAFWTQWAITKAEEERSRRLQILKKLQMDEEQERLTRRQWAIAAIEEEKQRIMRELFLSNTASTQWFQDTISPFCEDYEVVCPNSWFGCTFSCMLQELDIHLRECRYSQEPDEPDIWIQDLDTYDLVCPNAVLGCKVICPREQLAHHLAKCPMTGKSREKELEERMGWRQRVIRATEEERRRRIEEFECIDKSGRMNMKMSSVSELHRVYKEHTRMLQSVIHSEIAHFAKQCIDISRSRRWRELLAINQLSRVIQRIWPSAVLEPYGSFVTELNGPLSDVDVVVCGIEDCPMFSSNVLAIQQMVGVLAMALKNEDWILEVHAIEHASVPVTKVLALIEHISVPLDITFDDPRLHHNGIASAALILQLKKRFHGFEELALVLKHFLAKRRLNDPYTGGLSSYGLVLMITHFLLHNGDVEGMVSRDCDGPCSSDHLPHSIGCEMECRQSVTKRELGNSMGMKVRAGFKPREQEDESQPLNEPLKSENSYYLGKLLMSFLRYYSDDFQPELEGISVLKGGATISRESSSSEWKRDALHIEDPLDASNNVGRNCYRISHILKSFADFHTHLTSLVIRGGTHPEISGRPLDYVFEDCEYS